VQVFLAALDEVLGRGLARIVTDYARKIAMK
jgi:hypothetical protein